MATTGHELEAVNVQGLKASLQKLKTDHIDGKADEATTLAGYGITDAYTKTEVNGLVDTPHQNYVTVAATSQTTAATDVLPASGQAADTIYRVSNWDGSANSGAGAFDATCYSEYAWDDVSNPNKYVFLCVKSQIGEVFDISAYNNNAKYADLEAALGNDGANVPQSLRRGGMSVKYVQSSDNKYVQYRLMADTFSTTESDWQGIDDEPTAGSNNLVKSGGVFDMLVGTVKFIDGTQDAWGVLNGFVKDIYVIGADTSKDVSISYVFKNNDTPYIGKFCIQLAYFLPNSSSGLRKNFSISGTTTGNTLVQMASESGDSGIEVFIRTQNSPVFDSTSFIQPTDFRILKTGFGENVIPFVLDYIEKNKKKSVVVDANNYSTILPDLNNAEEGVVYRFLFSTIETSLPAHLPSSVWGNNGLASCIRFGSSTYSTQLLVTQACIYYRILGADWNDWETLTPIKEVTVGTGGNFTTLLDALKYTSDKTPIRILRNTVIDVEQEYISEYGSDFWTNYDGYDNHPNDMMYRGIWLGKGRELYGEENATIVFNYSGSNQNVKERFSLLAVAGDNYVHDLTLYPSNNCEYHIHDDWQTGTMESTQIKYERLIFKGSSYSTICIGGGLGNNCSYILKDCLFLCNEASNYNVSYHGCTSRNENAKCRIYATGCYGLGQLVFISYGVSTQLTDCIVSNCKFSKIDCFINPGQVNENMRLIAFNNTESGIS